MPRHFSEEEKNEIRKSLIKTGLELFEKYGVDKTNIDEITAKAGISKGSFYNFFKSKGDLFMEIYSVERQKVQDAALKKFKNSKDDIDVLLKNYANFLTAARKKRPILNIVYESSALALISDKLVRDRLMEYNVLINRQMTDMIRGWFEARGIFRIDPRLVTSMIRSINFLQFHDYAIGSEIYEQT
ncbi:MAG: TetR/AcrR family transcriptional regulator, partial [Lachnospiraceae bacterium]|nr:TetR/AcrR family transcriptional regulator [Lachnospiraceae bacterium]